MPRGISKKARDSLIAEEEKTRSIFTGDSFQNFALKLGMGTDNALSAGTYGFNPITRVRNLLEWIHRGSWLGGMAVDVVADDMTRSGINIISTMQPKDTEKIRQTMDTLGIWPAINDCVKWSRLYGGCIAVCMIDGQRWESPFDPEKIGSGQFKGLLVLDRWAIEPSLNDLIAEPGPNFGLPRYYKITASALGLPSATIHYTRCMRLEGLRLPIWQRTMENLWGVSVLERLYDRMIAFDSATTGASQLTYKSYLRTYKIKDLRKIVAGPEELMAGLTRYVDMMRRFQGIEGVTLLDADDELEAHTHTVTDGISNLLLQLGQQLAGALQIPLVRLFGQSPAGLNATGESDLRTYYDGIRQQQERWLRVPLKRILIAICNSEGIDIPDSFDFEFQPLWQLRDEDKLKAANDLTQSVIGALDAGAISLSTAMKELRQGARVTGVFSNISDQEIRDAESLPPPSEMIQEHMDAGVGIDPMPGAPAGAAAVARFPRGMRPSPQAKIAMKAQETPAAAGGRK